MDVKLAKLSKIYGGNTKPGLERGLQTTLNLPHKI